MKILIIGLPGSGKTTQAELLANSLNVPSIGSGNLLRQIALRDDEMAKKVKNIIASGQLVSDRLVSDLVRERVKDKDCKEGFVMEGYPRTIAQIKRFDPNFKKVIYINLSEDQIIDRLLNRGRHDDSVEVVKKRLEVQYKQMQKLVDLYKKKRILVELDGSLPIESLHQEIKKTLNG